MISRILPGFRKAFFYLPKEIQIQAKKTYRIWKKNPFEKSLNFKQIHLTMPIYSVRITMNWRALGIRQPQDTITWFWIGSHEEYNKMIRQLKQRKKGHT